MTKFQSYSHMTVHQKAGKKLDGLDLKEKDIQGDRGKNIGKYHRYWHGFILR